VRVPCACPLCVSPEPIPGACPLWVATPRSVPLSVTVSEIAGPARGPGLVPGSGDHPVAAAWPMAFAIVHPLLAEDSDVIEGGAVVWRGQGPDRFKSFC